MGTEGYKVPYMTKKTLTYVVALAVIALAIVVTMLMITVPKPTLKGEEAFELPIDERGTLLRDVNITSADGELQLVFAKGTRLLDPEGKPVSKVIISSSYVDELIVLTERQIGGRPVSPLYNFTPSGAILGPPVTVRIKYNDTLVSMLEEERGNVQVFYLLDNFWEMVPYRLVDVSSREVIVRLEVLPRSLCVVVLTTKPSQFD